MNRLGMYYNIMIASSGGIGIEYLERQPFRKITWLSRLAEVFLVKSHLDAIYAVNTGYSGEQKKLDWLQQRIDFLLLTEPKTDVKKLDKWKKKMRSPKKKKKRKRIKLDMKDK